MQDDNFNSENAYMHVCKTNEVLVFSRLSVVLVLICPALSKKKTEIEGQSSVGIQEAYYCSHGVVWCSLQ